MFIRQLFEKISRTGEGDTAVIGWGRGMGHKGHMMLASSVITQAKKVNGDPYFVVSRTVGKDDPLTADEKIAIYKKVFPKQGHIFQAASDELPDLTKVLSNLNKQGYRNATVVLGDEESKAFQFLKQYNGKPNKKGEIIYSFDNLDVIGRSATGDPSAGEEGPRATPLRNILNDPNVSPEEQFKTWRDAMSPEVSDDEVRALMAKAKERMAQFSSPKTTKKSGMTEGFFVINSKIKGKIQNIVSDLSDVPGMWDHRAQTFTPDGLDKLKAALQNNPKYIRYAVNLTAKDYEAEDAAGVGIITKQNTTKDVNKGTLRKMMKAFHLIDDMSKDLAEITEAPIEIDPSEPMNPMIVGTKSNPAKLQYRMLRAANQLKDLAQRAQGASAGEWETIARHFNELSMNIGEIKHALDELKKIRSKGGIRSRGIENF